MLDVGEYYSMIKGSECRCKDGQGDRSWLFNAFEKQCVGLFIVGTDLQSSEQHCPLDCTLRVYCTQNPLLRHVYAAIILRALSRPTLDTVLALTSRLPCRHHAERYFSQHDAK